MAGWSCSSQNFSSHLRRSNSSDDLDLVTVLQGFPKHFVLQQPEYRLVTDTMLRMFEDSKSQAPPSELNALIRYQLSALLLRINMTHRQKLVQEHASLLEVHRFKRFQQLVEQHFANWHQVSAYASALGCSEKSLARAAHEVTGVTAKMIIVARISLEAKRLLAHTTSPVARIAERLGFDEPTNFTKFFKREAGCTPAEFRLRQRGRRI